MMFDMKSARDGNTVSSWSRTVWRVFIEGKLFIDDKGHTCFDSYDDAVEAVFASGWMKSIQEYVSYSAKFFVEEKNDEWKKDFLEKILNHWQLAFEEYEFNNNYVTTIPHDKIKI